MEGIMAESRKKSNKTKNTQKGTTSANREESLQGNRRNVDPLADSMKSSQAGTNRPGTQSGGYGDDSGYSSTGTRNTTPDQHRQSSTSRTSTDTTRRSDSESQ
jgi:hypothetical protein